MNANDDFYGKELNLNCFYMHTIFGQKYLKLAIVTSVIHGKIDQGLAVKIRCS